MNRRPRGGAAAGAALFLMLAALAGCAGREGLPVKGVLLVTVDTLRPDRIHAYGNEAIATPALDSLAARGVLFDNAFSAVPVTLPSHTTIMTGLYPHQHGVRDNGVYRVPDKVETFAEMVRRRGWSTAAFVSAHVLERSYGIARGFDTFDDEMVEPLQEGSPVGAGANLPEHTKKWLETWSEPFQRRAELTVGRALGWFSERDEEKPFFCWVHLFDPHLSYNPPEPWDRVHGSDYDGPIDGTGESFLRLAREKHGRIPIRDVNRMIELYDGEVSYADHWLGRLLEAVPESTLVVFLSDHGEAFGEHGLFWEHQTRIFEETMRIPMIVAGPGIGPPGSRRDDLVSTVDIVPSLLDYLGLGGGGDLAGVPVLRDTVAAGRAIYGETHASLTAVPTPYAYKSVRTADWCQIYRIAKPDKVVETFLHHVPDDYREQVNLYAEDPGTSRRLDGRFQELLDLARVDDADPEAFWSLDEGKDRREQLKSLGYMGD